MTLTTSTDGPAAVGSPFTERLAGVLAAVADLVDTIAAPGVEVLSVGVDQDSYSRPSLYRVRVHVYAGIDVVAAALSMPLTVSDPDLDRDGQVYVGGELHQDGFRARVFQLMDTPGDVTRAQATYPHGSGGKA